MPGLKTSAQYAPKNFRLGVVNGVFNILAETLFDPTLVLVSFLSHLTQSPFLLGLVVPLRDGTWSLPQFWVSCFLQNRRIKLSLYRQMSALRIVAWLGLALSINLIKNPDWLLVSFFVCYGCATLASGISGLPFLEVVGKTINPRRRGEFFAWRLGMGGLLSIGASFLVRWMLDPAGFVPFPRNFGLLSILYFILGSFSVLTLNQVKEGPDNITLPRVSFKDQFTKALAFFKSDPIYRRFITMQGTLLMGGGASPFFAIFVQKELGGSTAMIGVYLGVVMATNLISNLFLGRISNIHGNTRVMRIGTIAGLLMAVWIFSLSILASPLGISGQVASNWLIPVFILYGIRGTAIGVGSNSLLLDISPSNDRSLYMGFTNSVLGIVLFGTALSGVLLALLGYQILFFLMVLLHFYALFSAAQIRVPSANSVTNKLEYLP